MAIFIPSECDPDSCPWSELEVFQALESRLSNDWYVFHSLKYLRDLGTGRFDGEIDFLLYHEQKGFLILEVKGGEISIRNGVWYQDGREIDPVNQALHNKYAVMNLLERNLGRKIPLRFAHALCFPSCYDKHVPWPLEAKGIVVTKHELGDIEQIVANLIDSSTMPQGIGGKVSCEDILSILSPEFDCPQKLRERMLEEDYLFCKLTEQQDGLLDALQYFRRIVVEGGAGTGKTMLAIRKALRVASEGGSVLYLCYNEMLAKRVDNLIKVGSMEVRVAAFFDYCVWQVGIPREEYEFHKQQPLLYSKVLPDLLGKYLDSHAVGYDLVIVDEGQDFTPQMWRVVERLVAPDGSFYVFYDPDQNIFRETLSIPDFGIPPVALTQNCRNTQKIFQAMQPYCTVPMSLMSKSPVGCDVIERRGDCVQLLGEELKRLRSEEEIAPSEIVILGGHSLAHTGLSATGGKAGDYQIVERAKNLERQQFNYYTYMRFKGCEARVVILFEVDAADARWNSRGLYTAMSRAVHQLVILRKD